MHLINKQIFSCCQLEIQPVDKPVYDFINARDVHLFLQLEGATYMEIHQAGGGIHYTVDHTRNASDDELFQGLCSRLRQMLRAGTTLVECKSGYGLEVETELKQLRVIDRARRELPLDISSTFLGAHAVPKYVASILRLYL